MKSAGSLDFKRETLETFLGRLSSASPAPGGGAAAALTAALGAALLEMVMRINQKRTGVNRAAQRNIMRVAAFRGALLGSMKKDAEAFQKLFKLWKAPKRHTRQTAAALLRSASTPYAVCRTTVTLLELAAGERKKTSAFLLSDLKEAAVLLGAAFQSARFNVEVNFKAAGGLSVPAGMDRMKAGLPRLQKISKRFCKKIEGKK